MSTKEILKDTTFKGDYLQTNSTTKKTVCMCVRMPHGTNQGGIACVVNSYLLMNSEFEKRGYIVVLLDYWNNIINKIPISIISEPLYAVFQVATLARTIKHKQYPIIHIHTSRKFLFVKDVFLGDYINRKFGTKIYLTIHVGDIGTVSDGLSPSLQAKCIRKLNQSFSKVFFMSDVIKNQFIANGLISEKAVTLYNFVNWDSRDKQNYAISTPLKLLYMASINREKGILELLQALQKADFPFHLDICGLIIEDSITEQFYTSVAQLSDRVTLHGYVIGDKKKEIIRKADIYILPSYREGMPLTVIEAMAGGCALLVTKVGALGEILNEDNVEWIEPNSSDSILNALRHMNSDYERIVKMKRTNEYKSKEFSAEIHIEKLCSEYDDE